MSFNLRALPEQGRLYESWRLAPRSTSCGSSTSSPHSRPSRMDVHRPLTHGVPVAAERIDESTVAVPDLDLRMITFLARGVTEVDGLDIRTCALAHAVSIHKELTQPLFTMASSNFVLGDFPVDQHRPIKVVVIGAGIAGILAAIRLVSKNTCMLT